jgi:hypothetical protein
MTLTPASLRLSGPADQSQRTDRRSSQGPQNRSVYKLTPPARPNPRSACRTVYAIDSQRMHRLYPRSYSGGHREETYFQMSVIPSQNSLTSSDGQLTFFFTFEHHVLDISVNLDGKQKASR